MTLETFSEDPYVPAVTPLAGNTLVERVPKLTFAAFMFEIAEPFEAVSNPWMASPVRVPTDVMFGCAEVTTDWAVATVPSIEEAGIFTRLAPDPENVPANTVPTTERLVRVPTEVMFGCEVCETTWATTASCTVPVTLVPGTFVRPEPDPEKVPEDVVPDTDRLERVPTEVIFGCEACETTRATVACGTFPVTFEPVILESVLP